jgi:hypothetical protein
VEKFESAGAFPLEEIVIDAVIDVDWSRKMRPTPLSRSRTGSAVARPPGGRASITARASGHVQRTPIGLIVDGSV